PDIAVVPGSVLDYDDHPTTATLIVEVADSTLAFDKGRKLRLYAAANIPEYWIVDLNKRRLLVFRRPNSESKQYDESLTLDETESVAATAAPDVAIRIADILP